MHDYVALVALAFVNILNGRIAGTHINAMRMLTAFTAVEDVHL
jgi:hypothetical protein